MIDRLMIAGAIGCPVTELLEQPKKDLFFSLTLIAERILILKLNSHESARVNPK